MKYYKKLIGDNIYLSPKNKNEEDIDKYLEWMNDFNVTDYIDSSYKLKSYSDECEHFDRIKDTIKEKNFNIVSLENDELIGSISLMKINYISRLAILGIFIGEEKDRNKGYGREAINLILDFAFRYLNLHSVNLELLDVNENAHKCYLKCGFKDMGRIRDSSFINGKYYDTIIMDILESEFNGQYIKNKNI